jgi:hypothetical protein
MYSWQSCSKNVVHVIFVHALGNNYVTLGSGCYKDLQKQAQEELETATKAKE